MGGGAHAGSNEIQGQEKKTPAVIKTAVSKSGGKITSNVLLSHKRTGRVQTEFYRGGWGVDYGNQVVICGAVILAAASNPIKSVSEIIQQISHVATHTFN